MTNETSHHGRRRFLAGGLASGAAVVLAPSTVLARGGPGPSTRDGSSHQGSRYKRLLLEMREESQLRALPSALPEAPPFVRQSPIGYSPAAAMVSVDVPDDPPFGGFQAQGLGPTFLSFGPMYAEGRLVIEESESHLFGRDGTLYNNQYVRLIFFERDRVVLDRQYNDTHHAWLTFSPHGGWSDEFMDPPTAPRVRLGATSEPVFEIDDEFELDPAMLADVVPSPSRPRRHRGLWWNNESLVRGLRRARASGDPAAVGSFYAEGFEHFIAGERPFGWDHLPLQEIYAPLVEHLESPLTVRYGPPLADGNVVIEEMDILGYLDNGTVYNNWHCFIHEIRDGRIVQTREYLDTLHVWKVLAPLAEWGATPVAPRSTPRRSNLQALHSHTQTPTPGLDLDRWHPFV